MRPGVRAAAACNSAHASDEFRADPCRPQGGRGRAILPGASPRTHPHAGSERLLVVSHRAPVEADSIERQPALPAHDRRPRDGARRRAAHARRHVDRVGRRRCPRRARADAPPGSAIRSAARSSAPSSSRTSTAASRTRCCGRSATSSRTLPLRSHRSGSAYQRSQCALRRGWWPAVAQPGDLVWVNDFHLCLVPAALRARRPADRAWACSGTSPSRPRRCSASARGARSCWPGMLGADLLAFQTDADTQNFLACVRAVPRRRGLDDLPRVRHPARARSCVGTLPVGVDVTRLGQDATSEAALNEARALRETLGTEVDHAGRRPARLHEGHHRAAARLRALPGAHPDWRGRVSLVQITAPSRFRVPQYRAMKQTIDEMVGRIVGRFTGERPEPARLPVHGASTTSSSPRTTAPPTSRWSRRCATA